MNNRYLYRAKRTDNGEWVEGYLVETRHNTYHDGYRIIDKNGINYDELDYYEPSFISYVIDKTTICQCTGLKDKNGKLIWENDVVCTPYVDPIFGDIVNDEILDDYTWKVVFVDGGFCVENEDKIINLRSFTNGNHIKAIGNIFDNPELLEK